MLKIQFLCLLLMLFVGCSCYSQSSFEKGYSFYKKNDYQSAITFFTEAIINNQDQAKSYMLRGAAKAYAKDLFNALSDLDSSKLLDSTNYKLYYHYGRAYLLSGFSDQALNFFLKANSMNSLDSDVHNNLGIIYTKNGDFDKSITEETIAISIDSTKADYFANRGWAKFQLKQFDIALSDFNKALVIKPNETIRANRGMCYFEMREFRSAINDFTQVINASPNSRDIIYQRGLAFKKINEKTSACADLAKSLELGLEISKSEMIGYCNDK